MFLKSLNIPGSGLTAAQYRLNIISQNITHVETTRSANGGAYRRKVPLYQEVALEPVSVGGGLIGSDRLMGGAFASYLSRAFAERGTGGGGRIGLGFDRAIGKKRTEAEEQEVNGVVRIARVVEDPTPGKMVYDPEHPDANEDGYVEMPNVEMIQEMVNMMSAGRSYEANVQVLNAMKAMAMRALELGR
ncbi:MAG: flagellar basal body rod protein FlgC [Oscillospiraceae bacterium]|nr:flagellar basal body rod protein FlgC [Oscillospiraceae bacterium]